MDNLLVDRRSTFRLGVMVTALSVMVLSIAMSGPIVEAGPWWIGLGMVGLMVATGVGLLFYALFARLLGGLMFLAIGVLSALSLIRTLAASQIPDELNLGWLLAVANAVATTTLLVWLSFRAIQVLLGKDRRASVSTARLAGGVLVAVAANHLWLAIQAGWGLPGTWSVNISPEGTFLVGFPGWPIWHVVLLVVSLIMLAGPHHLLKSAAAALLLLFAALVPLVIIAAAQASSLNLSLLLPLTGISLVPLYLSWWLRDELQRLSSGLPVDS